MALKLCGFVTGLDQWGRLHLEFPAARAGGDRFGTEAKLRDMRRDAARDRTGNVPVYHKGFVVRPNAATLYIAVDSAGVQTRSTAEAMVQKIVDVEIEPEHYDFTASGGIRGVSFRLISCLSR